MIVAFGSARLGRDAEVRFTPQGDAVTNLSLAFGWGKKDDSGHRQTTWVDAALWGRRAEALGPYLLKGTQVTVSLEDVHMEKFESRTNGEQWKLVGRVLDIDLGSRPEGAQEAPQRPAAAPPAPGRAPARAAPAKAPAPGGSGFDDFDDDIPF